MQVNKCFNNLSHMQNFHFEWTVELSLITFGNDCLVLKFPNPILFSYFRFQKGTASSQGEQERQSVAEIGITPKVRFHSYVKSNIWFPDSNNTNILLQNILLQDFKTSLIFWDFLKQYKNVFNGIYVSFIK